MGDFGQIIDPYRVAPAQGNIQDYGLFAARDEQTQALRVAQALAAATRQYLGQQQGLPQGVDPNAVQAYGGETQRQDLLGQQNTRANAQEGRSAQDHQSKYDYANKFLGALPQQSDPVLSAAQQGGGVYGAELLGQLLGGQFTRSGELENRSAMNDADNVAAENRLRAELQIRGDADVDKEAREQGRMKDMRGQLAEATKRFMMGDPEGLLALNPQLAGDPDFMLQADANKKTYDARQKQIADEEQAKRDALLKPNPVGSIQSKNEKSRARVIFEHTPIGAAIGKNAEGKPNMQTLAEHTPLGYLFKFLAGGSGQPIDPKRPIK